MEHRCVTPCRRTTITRREWRWQIRAAVCVLFVVVFPVPARGQDPVLLARSESGPPVWGALKVPEDSGQHPAIILLHASSGWRPEYLDMADRFSDAGFTVLVLDYYAETGGAAIGSEEKLQKWESWRQAIRSAVHYLQGIPSVARDRIALVGYSRGAFLAVSVAASVPEVKAVVDFYGGGGGGTLPLEAEVRGLPPLLILHGGNDSVVTVSLAEDLHHAVLEAEGQVEMHLFPEDDHGFNLPWLPVYSAKSDKESFMLALDFLRRRLRDGVGPAHNTRAPLPLALLAPVNHGPGAYGSPVQY
ncbi:MAG: dienelactone hydrolase family protein [Gemmatimonadota bacterium]